VSVDVFPFHRLIVQRFRYVHCYLFYSFGITVYLSAYPHHCIADEEVQQSVYTQLRDIVTHRKRSNFEKSHGNNNFTAGESDDNGNLEILVQGDSMGSNYKIKNRNITQVSRVMGRMAFVIDTYDYLETPDGSLATRYDAVFRNPQTGEIIKELEFEDTFEKVGDYYLMTKQVIRAQEKRSKNHYRV